MRKHLLAVLTAIRAAFRARAAIKLRKPDGGPSWA
ncbi:hypothetical protein GGE07_000812 [Sinorhizobium terangae]|nr:hypothetical protein [Sinorhizobium terangae]